MNRLLAALLSLIIGAALSLAVASPAHAVGYFRHYSPDAGFDDPIYVTCDWNTRTTHNVPIAEGVSSPCADTDGVFVASGKQIVCLYFVGGVPVWQNTFDATGWHKITDIQSYTCVHQLD